MNKSLLLLLLLLRIFKGYNESKEGKANQMEIFILFAGRYEELLTYRECFTADLGRCACLVHTKTSL